MALQRSSLSARVLWFQVVRTISALSRMIRLCCAIMIPVASRSCSSGMFSGCDGTFENARAAHSALSFPLVKNLNTSITFHTLESVFCPHRAPHSAALGTVARLWNIHTSSAVSCPQRARQAFYAHQILRLFQSGTPVFIDFTIVLNLYHIGIMAHVASLQSS